MKILVVDTYYPDFLKTLPFNPNGTYEGELRKVLDRQFGTSDFYSKNLKALGWDAVDVIANHADLQALWMREGRHWGYPLEAQIKSLRGEHGGFGPDVTFLQDLSLINYLPMKHTGILAAQLSCPWPGDEKVRRCDVIFTSFPHYIPRIEKLGVHAVYNPLAFEPSVLDVGYRPWDYIDDHSRLVQSLPRVHDCVFIGGVGNPSHWKRGMETLEAVAINIQTFKWWGYGNMTLPHIGSRGSSVLHATYRGSAWGRDMYDILLRSKIVLNRHGEVAEGFANNMRMYEATGCGALLVTDNETDLFADDEIVRYSSPQDAVDKIRYYLAHEDERAAIAAKGQKRTLTDHTYAKRMQVVSETLKEMLVTA